MRLARGPIRPSRDADVATSRAARLRLHLIALAAAGGALAVTATPAAAWVDDSGSEQALVGYLLLLLGVIVVAAVVWFIWVRAEIRSLQGPAFLVLRRDRADRVAISGAEREAQPGQAFGPVALGHVAVQNGVGAMPSPARPRPAEIAPLGAAGDVLVFAAVAAGSGPASPPSDATLQFLPGRLEFVGEPHRPDIHFVRQPGPATVITLGRGHGPTDRHVRLTGATVSRVHARLRYAGGRWSVSNLSATNPLRVNGRILEPAVETCVLVDGDRLELGELGFIFREK